MTIYLGLMSGTSMDGIDAALIDLPTQAFISGHTYPYSDLLKKQIESLMSLQPVSIEILFQTHRNIGEAFADAANQLIETSGLKKQEIHAIGSHGQTIVHAPESTPAYTVQLGCGHTIAAKTGLNVVADFRTKDLVFGGQGAPLAPLYHQVLFATQQKPLAVLNLGGIANLTILDDDGRAHGYDVGPGNGLLDAWIKQSLNHSFDVNGQWALTGNVLPALLQACQQDAFFSLKPPKSLDKAYFSLTWLNQFLQPGMQNQDVQATLVALTAQAVADAMHQAHLPALMIVCGGGVHNQALLACMQAKLPEVTICSSEAFGVHPDYIEAMMCAWLASQCLAGEALNLAPVTGGKRAVLGCVFPV